MSVLLRVLVDNFSAPDSGAEAEHGLSFFFTCDEKKFLLDVGASSLFATNACRLGIDISDVDYLILSHAHSDHTGGLSAFLSMNNKAVVYLSSSAVGRRFYSTRRGALRDISIDGSLLDAYKERFVFVDENVDITPAVSLLCNVPHCYPLPKANGTLLADDVCDDFSHELLVCISDSGSLKVLSPCTHCGLMNVLNALRGRNVTHFVGGLHLLDSDERHSYESEQEIELLAQNVSALGIKLFTGHCTGETARRVFGIVMGDSFSEFRAGDSLLL